MKTIYTHSEFDEEGHSLSLSAETWENKDVDKRILITVRTEDGRSASSFVIEYQCLIEALDKVTTHLKNIGEIK